MISGLPHKPATADVVSAIGSTEIPNTSALPSQDSCQPTPQHTSGVAADLVSRLTALSEDERRAVLSDLSADDVETLEYTWRIWARPDQLAPDGVWRTWLLLGGRGSGKTRSAAEWVREQVETGRRRSIAIIGPTADTLRRDVVQGTSGLLAISPPWNTPVHEPSQRRLVWPNGAVAHLVSSEEPNRIRGMNADGFWIDELTSLSDTEDCWNNLQFALRIAGPKGDAPAGVVSTTPKRNALLKAVLTDPQTVTTRSTTFDNAANLDASTLTYLSTKYAGSTLGRQELMAELLNDSDGALWTRQMIEVCRRQDAPKEFRRIVVAVDPSGGGSAETGIIVVGLGPNRHGYVLEDMSGRYTPEGWARQAVTAYKAHKADRIIAEKNFGGAMVESTLRAVDKNVPVTLVNASRGKAVRAEPVVALYEQQRIHHVGNFPTLEDQLCSWEPAGNAPSPDRLDALVWAITDLMLEDTGYDATMPGFDLLVHGLSGEASFWVWP